MQASDGNFYGTTSAGGANNDCNNGCGTVFKITPQGVLTTLYSFQGYPTEGSFPTAALVQASDGSFYGTTQAGGAYEAWYCTTGCGTVFKVTSAGTLTTLQSFDSANGRTPVAGLVQANNGLLYGTTYYGGTYGYGTIFRMAVVPECATCRP